MIQQTAGERNVDDSWRREREETAWQKKQSSYWAIQMYIWNNYRKKIDCNKMLPFDETAL